MCTTRILQRLNLEKRKNKMPRQQAKEKFQNVVRILTTHGATKLHKLHYASHHSTYLFIEQAKEIIWLIDAWMNHQKPQQLYNLVHGFYLLGRLDCKAVLNKIPDTQLDEGRKKSLMNMVSKVARYFEAARFLFRTAKMFPIARRMQVSLATLPENAFLKTPVQSGYRLGLPCMISRIQRLQNMKHIGQLLQIGTITGLLRTTEEEAENDLTKQACTTLTTGKIHAEVQLVFYCDVLKKFEGVEKNLLPPRVVCSSKKACFLCNLLVNMHGKMRTPWSHGKLYPGWRLPKGVGVDLQLQFNKLIEERIRDSVATLLSRRQKTSYPGPSESTLITLASMRSEPRRDLAPKHTDAAQAIETSEKEFGQVDRNNHNQVVDTNKDVLSSSESLSGLMELEPVGGETSDDANEHEKLDSESQNEVEHSLCATAKKAEEGVQESGHVVDNQSPPAELEKDAQTDLSNSSQEKTCHIDHKENTVASTENDGSSGKIGDTTKASDLDGQDSLPSQHREDGASLFEEYYHLRKGQEFTQQILCNQTKTFFTRSLVVQLEYSTESSLTEETAGKQIQKFPLNIRRLKVDEIAELKEDGHINVIDAEAMTGDDHLIVSSKEGLYVTARGVVFEVTFQ
jgi:hypothetical protein